MWILVLVCYTCQSSRTVPSGHATKVFDIYETTLRRIAYDFGPAHAVGSRQWPIALWFDAECRAIRRECRRLERKYRRINSIEDPAAWTKVVRKEHVDFRSKKNEYWTDRVNNERDTPSKLW
jgi:hypothetical protein